MRNSLIFFALLIAIFAFVVPPASASTHPPCQWVQVDDDNNPNTPSISVYGYWVDVGGVQAFIVCDPKTSEPIKDANGKGFAYINNGEYVQVEKLVVDRYETKQILDWDHPKQVRPVQVSLTMPNIVTSLQYDWDHYRETGELRKKATSTFRWPMDYSFARLVPGSDPDYWLVIAVVQNLNPFPVRASLDVSIEAWRRSYGSDEPITKKADVLLGPNETKYFLLNRGKKADYFYYNPGTFWSSDWKPGYSLARYNASLTKVMDPEYPDAVLGGGFYEPYDRWNDTDSTVLPLIPMRLAYDFYCWSDDPYKNDYYYGYWGGREWPPCFGHAEYDPERDDWSVSVSFSDLEKPWYISDGEWRQIINRATNNAVPALKKLFHTWFPKVPCWSGWNNSQMYVNGNTGEIYGKQFNFTSKPFMVIFKFLEPVPPSNAPPPPGSWWSNTRWGGWLYTTDKPRSSGFELPAPVLLTNPYYEQNYISIWYYGNVEAQLGQGTYIQKFDTDPEYYDPNGWMRFLPVLKARALFVEKYTFLPVEGDSGVLKKDVVPGYLLWVSTEQRPVLNVVTQPVEVRARCGHKGRNGGGGVEWEEWRWTPATGWQRVGSTWERYSYEFYDEDFTAWELSFNYNHTVSGSNPANFPVSWTDQQGGTPLLYWSGANALRTKIADLADLVSQTDQHGDWSRWSRRRSEADITDLGPNNVRKVDYINIDAAIPLSGTLSFAPGESKWLAFYNKTARARFWKTCPRHESLSGFQKRVLDEIVSSIIQPILSSQMEAAFGNGTKFTMMPTFKNGEGGIICGSQKYLVHWPWIYRRKWNEYGWGKDLRYTSIGFCRYREWEPPNPAEWGLYSYFGWSSPTEGVVVKAGDELLGAALSAGDRARTIILTSWGAPVGARYWRFYENGNLYPPDYPR